MSHNKYIFSLNRPFNAGERGGTRHEKPASHGLILTPLNGSFMAQIESNMSNSLAQLFQPNEKGNG